MRKLLLAALLTLSAPAMADEYASVNGLQMPDQGGLVRCIVWLP
jgi:hypothetical protein